jgi:hypothetical protein
MAVSWRTHLLFVADFMSLSEEDKATVRAVVDAMWKSFHLAEIII